LLYQGKGFDEVFFECADSVLNESLGETSSKVVSYYLGGVSSKIDPDDYSRALETLFGWGANLLEIRILEKLYSQFGEVFHKIEGKRFADYVCEIQVRAQAYRPKK
jgi:hypothetical protein